MSRKTSKIKFVGLHAHSVAGSIFDALGYPQAHMDFCYDNGGEALALTDHGNMNGLAYQVLHAKKMQEEGKDFKPIYGCEAYFIPSLEEWREEYEKAMEDKKRARSIKKDEQSGATVEDEGASKKVQGILRRRRHRFGVVQKSKYGWKFTEFQRIVAPSRLVPPLDVRPVRHRDDLRRLARRRPRMLRSLLHAHADLYPTPPDV